MWSRWRGGDRQLNNDRVLTRRSCGRCRGAFVHVAAREVLLVEDNVARRVDALSRGIVAPVPTMISRIANEDARRGSRAELVSCGLGGTS